MVVLLAILLWASPAMAADVTTTINRIHEEAGTTPTMVTHKDIRDSYTWREMFGQLAAHSDSTNARLFLERCYTNWGVEMREAYRSLGVADPTLLVVPKSVDPNLSGFRDLKFITPGMFGVGEWADLLPKNSFQGQWNILLDTLQGLDKPAAKLVETLKVPMTDLRRTLTRNLRDYINREVVTYLPTDDERCWETAGRMNYIGGSWGDNCQTCGR